MATLHLQFNLVSICPYYEVVLSVTCSLPSDGLSEQELMIAWNSLPSQVLDHDNCFPSFLRYRSIASRCGFQFGSFFTSMLISDIN